MNEQSENISSSSDVDKNNNNIETPNFTTSRELQAVSPFLNFVNEYQSAFTNQYLGSLAKLSKLFYHKVKPILDQRKHIDVKILRNGLHPSMEKVRYTKNYKWIEYNEDYVEFTLKGNTPEELMEDYEKKLQDKKVKDHKCYSIFFMRGEDCISACVGSKYYLHLKLLDGSTSLHEKIVKIMGKCIFGKPFSFWIKDEANYKSCFDIKYQPELAIAKLNGLMNFLILSKSVPQLIEFFDCLGDIMVRLSDDNDSHAKTKTQFLWQTINNMMSDLISFQGDKVEHFKQEHIQRLLKVLDEQIDTLEHGLIHGVKAGIRWLNNKVHSREDHTTSYKTFLSFIKSKWPDYEPPAESSNEASIINNGRG